MTCSRARVLALLCATVSMAIATNATAQTNTEIFQNFQWNFSTPGARANGMGRAFVGLADDATAVVANPAGLRSLTRPQVYLEFKHTNLRNPRLAAQDAILTGNTTNFGEQVNMLSFFSVAAPIGKMFTVSFTRHEFLNYKENFSYPPRRETDEATAGVGFFPVHASTDFTGASYSGTVAASVLGDKLRVGLTVSANRMSAKADLLRTNCLPTTCAGSAVDTGVKVNDAVIPDQTSNAGSATVGVLFRPNDMISAGFTFASGPTFKLSEDFFTSAGVEFTGKDPNGNPVSFPTTLTLHVPSRIGAGVAVRPKDRLLVSADVVRVNYSSLAKDFVITTSFDTLLPSDFTVRDVTEFHLGGEYNILQGTYPVFVRAGVFTNPDHPLQAVPGSDLTAHAKSSLNDQFNRLPVETKVFGTVGAGIVLQQRFQIDAAYVGTREFVISAAARF